MKNTTVLALTPFYIVVFGILVALIVNGGTLNTKRDFGYMELTIPTGYTVEHANLSGDYMVQGGRGDDGGTISKGEISFNYTICRCQRLADIFDTDTFEVSKEALDGHEAFIVFEKQDPGTLLVNFDLTNQIKGARALVPVASALDFSDMEPGKGSLEFYVQKTSRENRERVLDIIRTIEFPDVITF